MLKLRSLIIILSAALVACGGGSSSSGTHAVAGDTVAGDTVAECGYKSRRQTKQVSLFDAGHNEVTGLNSAGISEVKAEYTFDIKDSSVLVDEKNAKIFVHILAKFKRDWHKLGIFNDQQLASIKDEKIFLDLSRLKALALEPLELIERISISIESKIPYRFTDEELEVIAKGSLKCNGATLKGQYFSPGVTFKDELHRIEMSEIKLSPEIVAEIQQ